MYFSNSTVKSSRNIFSQTFNYDQNIDLSVTFFNLSLSISHTHTRASVVTDKLNRLLLISTSK